MPDSLRPSQEELFALPADDKTYYLYAPLRRGLAVVNGAALAAVRRYLHDGEERLAPEERAVVATLKERAVLGHTPPPLPTCPHDFTFCPCEVTLFPTSRCNLRCTYCYASSEAEGAVMDWQVARAGIDYVATNAGLMGREDFTVSFHGGGEPTLAWDLVRRCTEYAEETARDKGLRVNLHTASNGLLSERKRDYIVEHFCGINISLDGPKHIQDRQRPRRDGSGSFDAVMESIARFEATRFPYSVRATVTSRSVVALTETVGFFREACPSVQQVHVEPVWYCGRCRVTEEHPPDPDVFREHFIAAWQEGERLGMRLYYSGARLDTLTNKFCAAPSGGFSVTPEGRVSSCFEVVDPHDPRAAVFHYGAYDYDTARFVFDETRLAALRALSVEHLHHCGDCFCKWHCAGDCLAKALQGGTAETHRGSSRCTINRAITFAGLKRIAAKAQVANTQQEVHYIHGG